MTETSGSDGVENPSACANGSVLEYTAACSDSVLNSDEESLDFDLYDDEDYLLSYLPSELEFYDQKHGRISRRNGGRKLSMKARETARENYAETPAKLKGAGTSANKELRIKEMAVKNSKKKKENNTKKARKLSGIVDDKVATRRAKKSPSCLKNKLADKRPDHESFSQTTDPAIFYNNSDFVLGSGNSVKFDDQRFMKLLIELQDRDITPEDYDLLVQLDSSVKPKTLPEAQINSLRSDTVTAKLDDVCSICIEDYDLGEVRKFLPCGHYFHGQCIRTWLSWTSNRCPIDGREVTR